MLTEEINPSLRKLQKERAQYLEWSTNNTQCDRLRRFVVAHEFAEAESLRDKGAADAAAMSENMAAMEEAAAEFREKAAEVAKTIEQLSALRSGELTEACAANAKAEEELSKELVKINSEFTNKQSQCDEEKKARDALASSAEQAAVAAKALVARAEQQRAEAAARAEKATQLEARLAELQTQLHSVSAGMSQGADGSEDTLAGQLRAASAAAAESASQAKSAQMRLKSLTKEASATAAALKKAGKEHAKLVKELESKQAAHAKAEEKIAALGFDPEAEAALQATREELQAKESQLADRCDELWGAISARLDVPYDKAAVAKALGGGRKGRGRGGAGGAFNEEAVKGIVATLVSVKDTRYASALEVAAGGKLYQLVVDNEATGKAMLTAGKLRRRVTIIPLSKIRRGTLSEGAVEAAKDIGGDAAVTAMELVGYADEVEAAIEYVFGRHIICDDAATAKAVTFDRRVRAPTVTVDGDSFDPSGTLEGGSRPGGDRGGVLVRLQQLNAVREQLDGVRAELARVDGELAAAAQASDKYATLRAGAELHAHEAALVQKRIDASAFARIEAKKNEMAAQVEAATTALQKAKAREEASRARMAELEAEAADMEAKRKEAMAAVEKQIAAVKAESGECAAEASALAQSAEESELEAQAASKEAGGVDEQIEAAGASIAALEEEIAALGEKLKTARAQYDEARAALDSQRQALADCESDMKKATKERDALLKSASDKELGARKLAHKVERLERSRATADERIEAMLEEMEWIATERQYFGKPHTDYDFEARDVDAAKAELRDLEAQQAALAKRVNKKVVGMIEAVEKEYTDLMNKRRIVENDKSKIHRVIEELDRKKNEALNRTWEKVNRDFGSIFSTLLPGTTGKLVPPEGGSVTDGLEVRVAFGGVWKESLTELSGGQRSLLALSLILALLLFKPAPMYILDEVDAALDLSHTQNIGTMLRTHFRQSQFIVVSLKQGMFNNANVIFRTKFVDGVSTVTRTVPSTADKGFTAIEDGEEDDPAAAKGAAKAASAGAGGAGRAAKRSRRAVA